MGVTQDDVLGAPHTCGMEARARAPGQREAREQAKNTQVQEHVCFLCVCTRMRV